MSTRCQIGIYERDSQPMAEPTVLMYRHSDGYPDGPHGVPYGILPFLKRFSDERGLTDVEYLPAWLMFHLIHHSTESMARWNSGKDYGAPDGMDFLGHGICGKDCGFHGDIEYFYRINAAEKELVVYSCGWDMAPKDFSEIYRIPVDDYENHKLIVEARKELPDIVIEPKPMACIHQQDRLDYERAVVTIVSTGDVPGFDKMEKAQQEIIRDSLPNLASRLHDAFMNSDIYWEVIRQYIENLLEEELEV